MLENQVDISKNLFDYDKFSYRGLVIILSRHDELKLLEQIRSIYGSGDSFLRIVSKGFAILIFNRRLPGLITILRNDDRFKIARNEKGYFVLSQK